jgi:DNA-binding MarR family transcriptional regulator/GNAT superfamily N-acetyltransferase
MNSSFFDHIGMLAIGSRLRLLSERVGEEAAQLYATYGVDIQPKWFLVFHVLSQNEERTVTEIAKEIGHSHPSVSKIAKEMLKAGFLSQKKDKEDGRRMLLSLSAKGQSVLPKMAIQCQDVEKAIGEALAQTHHNLWKAMAEFEFLLDQQSLYQRVMEKKKERESKDVQIVQYSEEHQSAFKALNIEWIQKYFKVEPEDLKSLDNPDSYILDKGGAIFVALYEGEALGVCAMVKMDDPDYDYELAKMAVSPKAQGKGMGHLLGKAILAEAEKRGARNVYLESNTKLTPAINLYKKLGFDLVPGRETPYERCNIQMAIHF